MASGPLRTKTPPDLALVEEGFKLILDGLAIDRANDPHFKDTPKRAAEALYFELCGSLTQPQPENIQTTFPREGTAQMVLLRNIPVKSLCAHHLLPFVGTAAVAYIPGRDEILGLSKLSRIVDWYARQPQVQERLTEQVAEHLWELVGNPVGQSIGATTGGVGVLLRANHMCMCVRGVNHDGDMITSALRGNFMAPETRAEFIKLASD